MTEQTLWEQLAAPFAFSEIEVYPQTFTGNMQKALAIAYFDARAVRHRLNTVLGRGKWYTFYRPTEKGVICRLSVSVDGEWHRMEDGADYTGIAAFKGGCSDAFKRSYAALCNDSMYSVNLGWMTINTYDSGGKAKFDDWTPEAYKEMQEKYERQTGLKNGSTPAKPRTGSEDAEAPFGWKPDRFPNEATIAQAASDAQKKFCKDHCARNGITKHVEFRGFICNAYGINNPDGKGAYMLTTDFLLNAPQDSLCKAIDGFMEVHP